MTRPPGRSAKPSCAAACGRRCGSKAKGKIPVIISPDGHFGDGRYRADAQLRCATLARMGAMVYSYDLFAWGESLLQFKGEDHRRSLAMTVQALNGERALDYLLSLKDADKTRVAITGGSGGGSQTMLLTALDDRIKAMYEFLAKNLGLNLAAAEDKAGKMDESKVTIEKEEAQHVFGPKGEGLPANALHSFADLQTVFAKSTAAR
nr:hypothetical protein [Tanacetum cinerariifolium]